MISITSAARGGERSRGINHDFVSRRGQADSGRDFAAGVCLVDARGQPGDSGRRCLMRHIGRCPASNPILAISIVAAAFSALLPLTTAGADEPPFFPKLSFRPPFPRTAIS